MSTTPKNTFEDGIETIRDLADQGLKTLRSYSKEAGKYAEKYARDAAAYADETYKNTDARAIGNTIQHRASEMTDKLIATTKDYIPSDWQKRTGTRSAGKTAGIVALGGLAVAAGAFAIYYARERSQEEPDHVTLDKDDAFELRRYPGFTVAETTKPGDRSEALDEGFRTIADYIFAKDGGRADGASDETIAMTSPVIAKSKSANQWTVQFVMPGEYNRSELPRPAPGVTLNDVPGREVAVIRFSGRATNDELVQDKREELIAWLNARGLKGKGEIEYAIYNSPIVPGPLRRNELWVEYETVAGKGANAAKPATRTGAKTRGRVTGRNETARNETNVLDS